VSWSNDEEADGDGESDTVKRVTAMPGKIDSESKSGDEVLYHEKLTIPYNYQDINNIDTFKQLEEQEKNHQSSTGGKDRSSCKNF